MATTKYFCLSAIGNDPESAVTFEILLGQPNWNVRSVPLSTVNVLRVIGTAAILSNMENAEKLLQVSALLQSAVSIHSIQFINCEMVEIAQFVYLATRKKQQGQPFTMEFQACHFKLGAAISLHFLLKYGLLQKLAILDCTFDDETGDAIAVGLRANKSLRLFALDWHDVEPPKSLIEGTYGFLNGNKSIVLVGLNMTNQNLWDLYAAIEKQPKLQCLKLSATTLGRDDLGAISMMCFAMKTLKMLHFHNCQFSSDGLKFLVDQLSKHVAIRDLFLNNCQIHSVANVPMEVSWGDLKTNRLLLGGTRLGKDATFKLIDDLATNHVVECVDLRGVLLTDEYFEKLCNTLLLQNVGPSKLLLNGFATCASMIVNAFHQNTSVKRLSIDKVDSNVLVRFVQGLANMRGLRHLTIGSSKQANVVYTKAFFEVLEASMQDNTTLWGITHSGADFKSEMAKSHLPMINYYLAINCVGRHSLLTANIPVGIWAHVLAKSATKPDGIYFALSGKPNLVTPDYPTAKPPCGRQEQQPGTKKRRTDGL